MTELSKHLTPRVWLVGVGAASELLYLVAFLRPFPFLAHYAEPYLDMAQRNSYSHRAAFSYVTSFVVLFGLLALGWRLVEGLIDRTAIWIILGFGVVFAGTMVLVYPGTALDVYVYVVYNLVEVQYHHNPIFTAPMTFAHDPLIAQRSDGWGGIGAPYGPFALVLDAIPTILFGRNLLANLLFLKIMFSAALIVVAYLTFKLLKMVSPRHALSGALLVAWNPLLLFETAANGHNDMLMMVFVVLALYCVVEGDHVTGMVLLVASVMVKYGTAVLVPIFFVYALSRYRSQTQRVRYVLLAGGISLIVLVVGYAPFWGGPDTILNSFRLQSSRYFVSFASVASSLVGGSLTPDRAALLGRIAFVPVYLYLIWLSTRSTVDFLRACFLSVFCFLLLANTNFLQWYAISAAVLGAAVPRVAERVTAFALSVGVEAFMPFITTYFWIWNGVNADTYKTVSALAYLVSLVAPFLVLLGFFLWDRLPPPGRLALERPPPEAA